VCWAGNSNQPSHGGDRDRSASLDDLAPVLCREDVHCYSLQVGAWARDAARYPRLLHPSTPLATFAETARAIVGLDAVISVDTAVAHLAGSIGVPTILILHCAGDFRWGMDDTTPWYPSMHIIRQRIRSDWAGVVTQLMVYLDDWWLRYRE
jgi:hypothetical protein